MYKGTCHCGKVKIETTAEPKWLVDCNCSICRRLGAWWAHLEIDSVNIECEEGATRSYVQGDKTLATHSCATCGCTTHWENLQPEEHSQMALNFRLCEPASIQHLRMRKFDGADTWEFLD